MKRCFYRGVSGSSPRSFRILFMPGLDRLITVFYWISLNLIKKATLVVNLLISHVRLYSKLICGKFFWQWKFEIYREKRSKWDSNSRPLDLKIIVNITQQYLFFYLISCNGFGGIDERLNFWRKSEVSFIFFDPEIFLYKLFINFR